jgi:hypothetical protein
MGTVTGLSPMIGSGISGVESSGSVTRFSGICGSHSIRYLDCCPLNYDTV